MTTNNDEVIDRLLLELRQTKATLETAEQALYRTDEYTELSLVGGIEAILRELEEERNKVKELEKEIMRLLK